MGRGKRDAFTFYFVSFLFGIFFCFKHSDHEMHLYKITNILYTKHVYMHIKYIICQFFWCYGIINQVFIFPSIYFYVLKNCVFLSCVSLSAFLSSLLLSVFHHYKQVLLLFPQGSLDSSTSIKAGQNTLFKNLHS